MSIRSDNLAQVLAGFADRFEHYRKHCRCAERPTPLLYGLKNGKTRKQVLHQNPSSFFTRWAHAERMAYAA